MSNPKNEWYTPRDVIETARRVLGTIDLFIVWWVVVLALVAGFLGNFVLPIIGGIIAALLSLFLIEWARREHRNLEALRGAPFAPAIVG